MPKVYWDTVDIGDPIAPLTKAPLTRVQIAKFAAASMDWSPLHLDDEFAKSAGYGGVFAHGAISLGFAIEGIQKWMDNGRILRSTATFQKLVWPGDILTAKGVIVRKYEHNGENRVEVDVWAENQNHDIVMKGSIVSLLWRNDKDEKKSKTPWPPVSPSTVTEMKSPPPEPPTKRPKKLPQVAEMPAEPKQPSRPQPAPAAKPVPTPKPAPVAKPAPAAKAAPAAKVEPKKAAEPAKKVEPKKPEPKKPAEPAKKAEPKKAAKPEPKKAAKPEPKKAAKPEAKKPEKKASAKSAAPKKPEKKPAKKPEKKPAKKPEKKPAKKPEKKPAKKKR
jgi:acyl dehydratase